jgi:hypothetical protein|tara:strand:- start:255 stop:500 length:246 start_codon:yes stop_codon:yes gene_type:complete
MSMEHPFISDLSDKSLEECQETLSSLTTKINFAYNTGNQPLVHQLQMAISSYRAETSKKLNALFEKEGVNDSINIKGDSKK